MAGKGTQTPAWWYDGIPVPWTARLLAPLYGAVAGLRRDQQHNSVAQGEGVGGHEHEGESQRSHTK